MADKITLNPVGSLLNTTSAQTTINNNFATIQGAFDSNLSTSGLAPNSMLSELDMNSFPIINLPVPTSPTSPVRLVDVTSMFNVTNPTFMLGGSVQVGYATTQSAALASVPAGVLQLYTLGYYSVGDGGAAIFTKTGSAPPLWQGFTSADGAHWIVGNSLKGDTINSRVFGTVGNNAVDDEPSINAGMTFLASIGGGTLLLHPGTFSIRRSIQPPSNVSLQGSGRQVTFISYDLSSPVPAPFNCGILITGNLPSGLEPSPLYPITTPTEGQTVIQFTNHADVNNFTVNGFIDFVGPFHMTSGGYPAWWTTVKAINASTGQITITEAYPINDTAPMTVGVLNPPATNIKVSDLSLTQCADAIFQVNWAQHLLIENIDFHFVASTGKTIEIDQCKDVVCQNSNSFNATTGSSSDLFYWEAGGSWNITFKNLNVNGGTMLFDAGTYHSLIENCTFNYTDSSAGSCVFIGSSSQRNRVIGCSFNNIAAPSVGVVLQGDESGEDQGGNIIMGNVFSGADGTAGAGGISVAGSSNNIIVGNHFSNMQTAVRVGTGVVPSKNNVIGFNTFQNVTNNLIVDGAGGSSILSPGETPQSATIIQGTATPNVSNGSFFQCFNSVPTTITSFVGGHDGQIITIQPGDTNTTISTSAAILAGGNNWSTVGTPSFPNQMITLRNISGAWYEMSRTAGTLPLANFANNTWNFVNSPIASQFITTNGQLGSTNTGYSNNAGGASASLTNAPVSGNPTRWIPINDNGTIRNIPAW